MTKRSFRDNAFWFALGSVALGQAFMALTAYHWTLWVGLGLYGVAALGVFAFVPPEPKRAANGNHFPLTAEILSATGILMAALVLRVFRLSSMPTGLHSDQGLTGLNALRILKEGWNPFFEAFRQQVPEPLLFTQLAGWFGVIHPSILSFRLFFVLLSLAALPLLYYIVRRLAGPKAALLTLAVLSVMRWHMSFSRNGYPTIQVPLYLFAVLALYFFGLRNLKQRQTAFIASGAVLGLGLYTYQAFKAAPLLIALLLLIDRWYDPERFEKMKKPLLAGLAAFLILAAPYIAVVTLTKNPGNRERDLWIFSAMRAEKSIKPLARNLAGTALMFNRTGDENPRHNLPGRRMLDDLTGIFFVMGLLLALRNIHRRRADAYALAGLSILSLPALLAADSTAQSSRLLGITPFVAYLAARTLLSAYERLAAKVPRPPKRRRKKAPLPPLPFAVRYRLALLVLLLGVSALLNAFTYFHEQAGDPYCWRGPMVEATQIGRLIAREGKKAEFYVSPVYKDHHTVAFLSYRFRDHVHTFEYPRDLAAREVPEGRDVYFVLEDHKAGVFEHLKKLYPDSKDERFQDPEGRNLLYILKVPEKTARSFWGLRGTVTSFKNSETVYDFDVQLPSGPFQATFEGSAWFEESGLYSFEVKTSGAAFMRIGQRSVRWGAPIAVTRGYHFTRLVLWQRQGPAELEITMTQPDGRTARFDTQKFLTALPLSTGLKGVYSNQGELVRTQWDPQINFTSKKDFPFKDFPPFTVRWKGSLEIKKAGLYHFEILTTDEAALTVGRAVILANSSEEHPGLRLEKDTYPIALDYLKKGGDPMALHLLWMKPGDESWEIVPPEAFGPTD